MKKSIIFGLLAITMAVFFACQNTNSNNTTVAKAGMVLLGQVPELLDRNEKIQFGKEWENVQNAYGKERKALMENPNAKEPWLNLAELFIQEARVTGEHPHYYPAALECLEVLLSKPFNENDIKDKDLKFRALSAKASVELSQHEFSKALETGEMALKLNPYNSGIYGVLTDAHVELGHYEEAVEMADKMVSIKPDLRSYSRVSYLREIYGDVPGAIEALTMAVNAGAPGADNTAWAMVTLGKLYLQYGKMVEAERVFQSALEMRPGFSFAMAGMAEVEIERKNYTAAEKLLNQATSIIPEVGFYESLAIVYQKTGRDSEYSKTINEVVAMMNDDATHGHNMDLEFAKVYSELFNKPEMALEYALKEYRARPENIDVNGELAKIYSKMGDTLKAKEHRQKALRTGSKNPDYLAMN